MHLCDTAKRQLTPSSSLGVKCFTDRGQALVRRLPSVSKVRSARRGGVGSRHNAALAARRVGRIGSTCERICERNAAQLPVVLGTRRDGLNAKPAVACMFETWASIQHRHWLAYNPEVASTGMPVYGLKSPGNDEARHAGVWTCAFAPHGRWSCLVPATFGKVACGAQGRSCQHLAGCDGDRSRRRHPSTGTSQRISTWCGENG